MRSRIFLASLIAGSFALAAAAVPGCNCDKNPTRNNMNGDMGVPAIGSITIDPADVTLDLTTGQPPPTQAFTVTFHGSAGDQDVTGQSTYALTDLSFGVMNLNVFTAGTDHGGTTQLVATYQPSGGGQQMALATIHVRVHGAFQGPDCMGGGCGAFPPDTAPMCTATGITPQIYYPPTGVLLPPNMEKLSVQWTPFPGGPPALPIQEFEIDFENANTDVRIVTKCASQLFDSYRSTNPVNTTGRATGGCALELSDIMSANVWDFIAKSNRGGEDVKITVRATTDGMCATTSTNSVNIAIAEQDLNGGIFYWKSTTGAINSGVGGQIWAKSFGDQVPEEQMTGPGTGGNLTAGCHGCHSLSRDGKYMVINFDDDDSDDEYGDTQSSLVDVKMKKALLPPGVPDTSQKQGQPPGFQTLNPDHSLYLGTNGDGSQNPSNMLYLWDGTSTTAAAATPPIVMNVGPAMGRPTMIDWSADGAQVLFVLPSKIGTWNGHIDDDHIFGGSIYSLPYDTTNKTFGTATAVITSQGENNYYPSYSPDGAFMVFNRVPLTGTMATIATCTPSGTTFLCPNDSFANPAARIWLMSTKAGAMPVDAENANGSPAASPVPTSNSWPRWSPFIQAYKNDKLLWVTFSSTRDYGLRVRNHVTGMVQCYPSDSLEDPNGAHNQAFPSNCQQPQIWMAAIDLSHLEFAATDPSFPAFYLPFQADVDTKNNSTHNHTAQWTQTVVTQPPPDMANCIPSGGMCTPGGTPCCAGGCFGGTCGIP